MKVKNNIVVSQFPPKDTNVLWLKDNKLHIFGNNGWEVTSSNKEELMQDQLQILFSRVDSQQNSIEELVPKVDYLILDLEELNTTIESNNTKLLKSINDLKVEQTKLLSRITALEEANNPNPQPETK